MKKMLPQLKCYYHPSIIPLVEHDYPRTEAIIKFGSLVCVFKILCLLSKFKNIKSVKISDKFFIINATKGGF